MVSKQLDKAVAWGVPAAREPRWPASLAVGAAVALTVTLPNPLVFGRWVLLVVEAVLVVPITIAFPFRHQDEPTAVRWLALVCVAVAEVANLISLGLLVQHILNGGSATGRQLVVAAIQIYVTNVLRFGLWFWELDRGGPGQRMQANHRHPDFLFPQMVTPEAAPDNWTPSFVDYLYVSSTNASAFSPTDTMPLSVAAKLLMLVEATAAVLTVAIVAARAINILK
ncbi:MAG: hypothetical protein DLM54_05865 [Acidimicrobiales bacterium]|nr:MAG: hypothetical protein DLM54_05865 [Acidimicrobiales bacterium]